MTIREGEHIGAGAIIILGVKIGKKVSMGAELVIIRDMLAFVTIVGNSGRVI